jgi:hypothetical protein
LNLAFVVTMRLHPPPVCMTLVTSILTIGCVLSLGGCASTKLRATSASQSIGMPTNTTQNSSLYRRGSEGAAAQSSVTTAPAKASASGQPLPENQIRSTATAGNTARADGAVMNSGARESSSMTVTTTTRRSDEPQIERAPNRVWPFLVGVGAALAAGLFLLTRRARLRAR